MKYYLLFSQSVPENGALHLHSMSSPFMLHTPLFWQGFFLQVPVNKVIYIYTSLEKGVLKILMFLLMENTERFIKLEELNIF